MIAKSEWRGGDQKKMEKMEFDMPTRRSRLVHSILINRNYENSKKIEIRKHIDI